MVAKRGVTGKGGKKTASGRQAAPAKARALRIEKALKAEKAAKAAKAAKYGKGGQAGKTGNAEKGGGGVKSQIVKKVPKSETELEIASDGKSEGKAVALKKGSGKGQWKSEKKKSKNKKKRELEEGEDGGGEKRSGEESVWGRLGLSHRLCLAVKHVGFRLPTPIQRKCIPAILKGKDVLATARTGSGKTAAFLLPMLEKLDRHEVTVGVRAVVLSPTRELALQTSEVCKKLMFGTDLRLCLLIGGLSMEKQFDHLVANPDIIVATPGRLTHHMVETNLQLSRCQMVVMDEGDRLFELGMDDQVETILSAAKLASRQFLLFTATLPSTLVQFVTARFPSIETVQLDADRSLPASLALSFFYVRESDALPALLLWLKCVKPREARAIVFCATTHHVLFLAELLAHIDLPCAALYSALDQEARQQILANFRSNHSGRRNEIYHDERDENDGENGEGAGQGRPKIILATDVAARGVDIPQLEFVFHFNFPSSAKLFVHRSGRTARNNRAGHAISLVQKDELPYAIELATFLGFKFQDADALAASTKSKNDPESSSPSSSSSSSLTPSRPVLMGLGSCNRLLDTFRDIVSAALHEDPSLARAAQSMKSGHAEYMRHREPASKMSLRRAGDLLNSFGGPQKMAATLHPALAPFVEASLHDDLVSVSRRVPKGNSLAKDHFSGANAIPVAPSSIPAAAVKAETEEDQEAGGEDAKDNGLTQIFPMSPPSSKSDNSATSECNIVKPDAKDCPTAQTFTSAAERLQLSALDAFRPMMGKNSRSSKNVGVSAPSLLQMRAVHEARLLERELACKGLAAKGEDVSDLSVADDSSADEDDEGEDDNEDENENGVEGGDDEAREEGKMSESGAWRRRVKQNVTVKKEPHVQTIKLSKLSAAMRRRLKKSGGPQSELANPDLSIDKAADQKGGGFVENQNHYVGAQTDKELEAKERELSQNSYFVLRRDACDFMADDPVAEAKKVKKRERVSRWNPVKKRYEVVALDERGKRLKNEAGAVTHGQVENKGIYAKWAKRAGRQLQRPGDMEDARNNICIASRLARQQTQSSTDSADIGAGVRAGNGVTEGESPVVVEGESRGKKDKVNLASLTKDKGLIEKVQKHIKLTHKEQRKVKKLVKMAIAPITNAGLGGESTLDLRKMQTAKQKDQKNRARQDPKFRKDFAKRSKDKFMAKNERKIAQKQQQLTRSFTIIKRRQ